MRATLPDAFFARDAATTAHALIGVTMFVNGVGGRIVETEAYDAADPASHSFNGPTARNAVMFGPPGHAYVYRSYGLHWCFNIVCGGRGLGGAVLIRAIEPVVGLDVMRTRRAMSDLRKLCAGPGRLCQALAIDGGFNGRPLDQPPFVFAAGDRVDVVTSPRIGITRAVDTPWRFCLAGSPYLSRPVKTV